MACVHAALESGRLATVEYRLHTILGRSATSRFESPPASDDEVVAIVRDVTDLHDVTRELKESLARLWRPGTPSATRRAQPARRRAAATRDRRAPPPADPPAARDRPDEVPALVEAAQTELTLALEEIRELVRGLHPRLLGDRGLGPALDGAR